MLCFDLLPMFLLVLVNSSLFVFEFTSLTQINNRQTNRTQSNNNNTQTNNNQTTTNTHNQSHTKHTIKQQQHTQINNKSSHTGSSSTSISRVSDENLNGLIKRELDEEQIPVAPAIPDGFKVLFLLGLFDWCVCVVCGWLFVDWCCFGWWFVLYMIVMVLMCDDDDLELNYFRFAI